MFVPTGLVLFTLLAAFVLSALCYYKLNPERVVVSLPFLLMATPLALLVSYLVLTASGLMPPGWSAPYMLAALATLAIELRQARCFRPKAT